MDPLDAGLVQQVGQTIAGRWTLRRLIGAGGMAAVYAADNPEGRFAAVKLLYPEMARRHDIRERFLREAAVMARIVHSGMVAIYEQGQSGDQAYLIMELLAGETVADRVRRMGRLDVRDVLVILDQVLDVLVLAHSMGIIHRDLKPENLFLTQDGRVKVLDFGLARLLDTPADSFRTRTGAALGTLPYMAPEQALGRRDEVDARTDIFAVGATAFRLLTGRRIHDAPSEAELLMCMATQPAQPLVKAAPDLSPDLGAVVDRALAFAKLRRYPDATTMQNDVRALLAGQTPTFAVGCSDREEVPTRADRQAPAIGGTVPLPPNSTRPLHAALPASPSPIAIEVPPVAMGAAAEPTQMEPLAPTSRRDLPATVVMPASIRDAATVFEPVAAQSATIPVAPVSGPIVDRRRRRTHVVALSLILGLVGVASAGAYYVFLGSNSPVVALETLPSTSPSVAPPPSQPLGSTQSDHSARKRPPPLVMSPLDEPPPRSPADFAPPRAPRVAHPPRSGAAPQSSSVPQPSASTSTVEHRAGFVAEPSPVSAAPNAAAAASPPQKPLASPAALVPEAAPASDPTPTVRAGSASSKASQSSATTRKGKKRGSGKR